MSFILDHHRLFNVSVQEDGSGKVLSGFTFRPSGTARRRLSDHQLIFRGVDIVREINRIPVA